MKSKTPIFDKIFTIPNIITFLRLLGSIWLFMSIGMYGIVNPFYTTLAACGLALSDLLDGFISRKYHMSSKLGSILDPIADKFFNWGLAITLMIFGNMPLWPLIIGIRDIMVGFISMCYLKKYKIIMKPTLPAKLKMAFQSVGVIGTLAFGFGTAGLSLISFSFMILAILMVIPEIFCIKKQYFSNGETIF